MASIGSLSEALLLFLLKECRVRERELMIAADTRKSVPKALESFPSLKKLLQFKSVSVLIHHAMCSTQ